VLQQQPIEVLILDINFPDGNSITILPEVKKINPAVKIMIFSAFDESRGGGGKDPGGGPGLGWQDSAND
jgi:two-component SAPR family response regulator